MSGPDTGEHRLNKAESEETLVKASSDTDVHIVRCSWVLERKSNRTIQSEFPSG